MAIKTLPSKEHTFSVEIKGSGTGKLYQGQFTYKRPTLRTRSDIAKTKALLDGGLILDEDTDFIHKVLSNLRHTLVASPAWWVDEDYGFEMDEGDVNVVLDIYKECDEFEKAWFDEVWAPKAEESEKPEQKTSKAAKASK